MSIIIEGGASIFAELQKIVNKKMPVFYNIKMIPNRDFSLLVLKTLEKNELNICDPLAGSGIRSLRILKEPDINIKKIVINDIKKDFKETIQKNIELNKLNNEKIIIKNEDANTTLNTQGPFDYVEIDPFGTPNPFLDTSIKAIRNNGILSVTATDTSALCGSYPVACKRKYWASPLRNELMHEFAVRILIRKVQLLGAHHEKALLPLVSFSLDHYIKIFFKVKNGKKETDKILKQHGYHEDKGPVWLGKINDEAFLKKMKDHEQKMDLQKTTIKLLNTLIQESTIQNPFFYDLHKLGKEHKTKKLPKIDNVIDQLKKQGHLATRTHFCNTGIKTTASKEELEKIILEN